MKNYQNYKKIFKILDLIEIKKKIQKENFLFKKFNLKLENLTFPN